MVQRAKDDISERDRSLSGKVSRSQLHWRDERTKGMKKVMVLGCGAYIDSGYGCPGEWRCLKAAAVGEGEFEEPAHIVGFVKCECPGRSLAPNVGMAMKLSELRPDAIHLSTCMAHAKPDCPYEKPEQFARMLQEKTGIPVVLGTHDYH
jgi:predicted metal-binding protein